MCDVLEWLGGPGDTDLTQAFAVIGEGVWWVTRRPAGASAR